MLGRLHAVGANRPFEHREALTVDNFGHQSLATLLEGNFIPKSLLPAYESVARDLLKKLDELFARVSFKPIRMHGDCHPGNLLCRDDTFHVVDLDDCRMGPAVQDLWMMLAGERHERLGQLSELVDGYQEFHDFDPRELPLIEGLRSLRLMHYSAWLARRWDDPAFPPSFPGSAASATGASRCWFCASNWQHWMRSRCGCSEAALFLACLADQARSCAKGRRLRRSEPAREQPHRFNARRIASKLAPARMHRAVTVALHTFASRLVSSIAAAQTSPGTRPRIVQPLISCLTKDAPWPPPIPVRDMPWA